MNPYEKSRIINYAKGAQSEKQAHIAKLKADYERSFTRSLEYEADAKRNGVRQEFIARKTRGSQRYELASRSYETFFAGDIIECYGSRWIVTEVNANKDIYTTGYMERCNQLFKMQIDNILVERWGVLDAGVYSTTITETMMMPELNKQFKIYLPLDDQTKHFAIGKRFATGKMYDSDGKEVLTVYRITGFNSSTENYGNDKLLVLDCRSDMYDPSADNLELEICNYQPYAPTEPVDAKCSISYVGSESFRIGGAPKTFTCAFIGANGDMVSPSDVVWTVDTLDDTGLSILEQDSTHITMSLSKKASFGTLYNLTVASESLECSSSLLVRAVSMI